MEPATVHVYVSFTQLRQDRKFTAIVTGIRDPKQAVDEVKNLCDEKGFAAPRVLLAEERWELGTLEWAWVVTGDFALSP